MRARLQRTNSRLAFALALALAAGCGGQTESTPPETPVRTVTAPPPAAPAQPVSAPASAALESDEGMWLLNDFPSDRLAKLHGFGPSKTWLDHVRLSSVRLALGCSGSVVSGSGLVMTNHHCAEQCISQLSTPTRNLIKDGFYAKTEAEERKCPGMEINQLTGISDVTARVMDATRGKTGSAYFDALKGITATVEKECATDDSVRCDVVSLYRGGLYHLYRYRRFQDVRLVLAPEEPIANFGGDPDNFMFPRYSLDMSFVRIWDAGKPLHPEHFFEWSKTGAKEGDLTFVSGHPGRTSRQLTMAQLAFERDVRLPNRLMLLSELRGVLLQFGARGVEEKRVAADTLHSVENGLKAYRGRREALVDEAFMKTKRDAESALRDFVMKNAQAESARGAFDEIEKSQVDARRLFTRYALLENTGIPSDLFYFARSIVRASDELAKKNEERLPEFTDSKLPRVKAELFADAPVHASLERVLLEFGLSKMREFLGPDDPLVKRVLGKKSPAEVAAAAVNGTKLKAAAARKAMFEGGKSAITASNDPMIALAKAIDDDARAVRKEWEDKVDAIAKKNGELIAKARFAIYGTSQYPDATFSLRLSYGTLRGWTEGTTQVKPFTTLAGLFDRATGSEPFVLPPRWIAARPKLEMSTPLDFVTTNDIIGGNSGSPVIDKDAKVVGLIFDGNIHSLGGDFGYDGITGRAVAVDARGIVHALDKVYGATRILAELGAPTVAAK